MVPANDGRSLRAVQDASSQQRSTCIFRWRELILSVASSCPVENLGSDTGDPPRCNHGEGAGRAQSQGNKGNTRGARAVRARSSPSRASGAVTFRMRCGGRGTKLCLPDCSRSDAAVPSMPAEHPDPSPRSHSISHPSHTQARDGRAPLRRGGAGRMVVTARRGWVQHQQPDGVPHRRRPRGHPEGIGARTDGRARVHP